MKNKFQIILFIFVCLMIIIGYFPLKFAERIDNYSLDSDEYIICMEARITGYKWQRIVSFNDVTLEEAVKNKKYEVEFFNFADNSPTKSVFYPHISNTYIAYTERLNEPIKDEFDENKIYICKNWEIIYPIKRETPFKSLFPKCYLCVLDIVESKQGIFWAIIEMAYFLILTVYLIVYLILAIKFIVKNAYSFFQKLHEQ